MSGALALAFELASALVLALLGLVLEPRASTHRPHRLEAWPWRILRRGRRSLSNREEKSALALAQL